MKINQMYQVSTLQALMLGYTKGVITVKELSEYGSVGLGTFKDVNGEMIVIDQKVYKANNNGEVIEADLNEGVPFAAVAFMDDYVESKISNITAIDDLKHELNKAIDEDFALNSMHVVRIDGHFKKVKARSEEGQESQHVELSEILKNNQQDFFFDDVSGSLVCLYFPDYMDGINAAGWHFHFISDDKTMGGHVYDVEFELATSKRTKLHNIQIQLPTDIAFDTYSLKSVSKEDVKKVEQ